MTAQPMDVGSRPGIPTTGAAQPQGELSVDSRPLPSLVEPPSRSRLGTVVAVAGAGLFMQGVADALARNGDTTTALRLFVVGFALIFGACAWRLTGAPARRNERLLVSLVLGLGLLVSYVMRYPLLQTRFDELQHRATLSRLLSSHALFPPNTLLAVSPYYPGLELATATTRWLTGLPLGADQLIVLVAVRVLLVLGLFLVVERVCRSARAAGVAALVYMSNSQFYGFDSQYAYETMALALAVAAVYLLVVSIDRDRPAMGRLFVLALCTVAAVVLTHHLTGWLTVGLIAVWAIGLAVSARFRKGGTPAMRVRWQAQAKIIGIAAAFSVVVGGLWTLFVGAQLIQYLDPIFSSAYSNLVSLVGQLHGNRQLFQSSSGGVTPTWEIALILGAAGAWGLILIPSLYAVIFKRSVRGGPLRYLPAVIAAIYPLLLVANISSGSKEVAGRATAFIFFGVALIVGAWVAQRMAHGRRRPERVATIVVATLCGVGGVLFGVGSPVSLVPGPYQVGGDEVSLGAPSLAVAHWADMNIPAGTHVAADRDNGDLLNAIGGVEPVEAEGGLLNPELLYFDHTVTPYDITLIRQDDIRYVFVDDRLARGLPLYGVYVAAGEPHSRLTLEQLNKFDSYPGVRRVYDNGPIKVYDVSALLKPSQRAAPTNSPDGGVGSGVDVGIVALALLVAAFWLLRLWRARPLHVRAHVVLYGLTISLLLSIAGAFVVRLTRVPPEAAAVVALVVLGTLSFWWPARRERPAVAPARVGRSWTWTQALLALSGGALIIVGAWVATAASLKEWTPPPELALVASATGDPVAQVQLGSAGPVPAQLRVTHKGQVVSKSDLVQTTKAQHVTLPASAESGRSQVELIVNGKVLRMVAE